jgi:guanylate kinase
MVNKFNFKSILIVISSPSGAGKTSLANAIVEENKNIYFSTSVTTRPPRDGEENGREYIFTNKNKFDEMIKNGEFIEYAEVFGNYYGTPKGKTEEFLIFVPPCQSTSNMISLPLIKNSSVLPFGVP